MQHQLRQSASARAWDDCFVTVGNAVGAGLGVLIAAVLGVVSSFLLSVEDPRAQAVLAAVLSIIAFVTLATVVFLAFLAAAPYRQRNEARDRVERLDDERIPRMTLSPRAGRASHGSHAHLMWAELDVTNLSPVLPLKDVEVRITDLKDEAQLKNVGPDWRPWNALQIVWSPTNAEPNQFRLTIPPGETRSALIAYSDDSNGPPAVFASPHAGGRRLTSGPHQMTVRVSSPDSTPRQGAFYIECHPNYLTHLGGNQYSLHGPPATMELEEWDNYVERSSQKSSEQSSPGTASPQLRSAT
jgi:hypothetical protein